MRLGAGEAHYKGNELFIELCEDLRRDNVSIQPCLMGRGSAADARAFADSGMEVHLNASEEEKWHYLRGLDVFVSCSLWEGFNLPLVEAQALGTLGLALDTGAHPEVTPFVMSSLDGMRTFIAMCAQDRARLSMLAHAGYQFVRGRFSWRDAAWACDRLLVRGEMATPSAFRNAP